MGTDPIFRAAILGMLLAVASLAGAEERRIALPEGGTLQYRLISEPRESARAVALELLRHLAAGELEAAAALSNAPQRRLEVLERYRATVGENELRRIYAQHLAPQNRVVLEAAVGRHRLLVWELEDAGGHLSGQYFVESGAAFLLDDVPSAARRELERLLHALRAGRSH